MTIRIALIQCVSYVTLRTPDVQAPAKPKKEEVTAVANSMISRTSAGRVHTSKGQGYPLNKQPSNEPSIIQRTSWRGHNPWDDVWHIWSRGTSQGNWACHAPESTKICGYAERCSWAPLFGDRNVSIEAFTEEEFPNWEGRNCSWLVVWNFFNNHPNRLTFSEGLKPPNR